MEDRLVVLGEKTNKKYNKYNKCKFTLTSLNFFIPGMELEYFVACFK